MKKLCYLLVFILVFSCSRDDASEDPDPTDPNLPGLALREIPITKEGYSVVTNENFAFWWDQKFDHTEDISQLKGWLSDIREDVKVNLKLGDPPNTGAGYYYNVYIHHGEDDSFPNDWGNGQGFDEGDMPYLTIPYGALEDYGNTLHEGFHVFQTSGDYQAIDTDMDAVWFIEASAEWYQCSRNAEATNAFITAGSVYANPQFSLWYIPDFWDPNVPADNDWLYGVRQYGVSVFLYYLSNVKSVDRIIISGVYSEGSALSAQEYLYYGLGEEFRQLFADWAVQTAVGFDYLTEEQRELAFDELDFFTEPTEINAHVLELNSADAIGSFSPDAQLRPASWAYNSIKIINSGTFTKYTFVIEAEVRGSEGVASHFEARVAVINESSEISYYSVDMSDNTSGQITVLTEPSDDEIYLVIASVPEHFSGYQTFNYSVNISQEN